MELNSDQKIKFTLGVLAVVAVISVFSLFSSAKFPSSQTATIADTQINDPDQDTDHDGLSNRDESLWGTDYQNSDTDSDGFKDGEEVASNHDPKLAGPNDLLPIDKPQNVTNRVNDLLLGGLAAGSLQPESTDYAASADQIVNEILNQTEINLGDISKNQIVSVAQTDENEKRYAQTISPLLKRIAQEEPVGMKSLLEAFGTANTVTDTNHPALASFFNSELSLIQTQIVQLQTIPAPKDWLSTHDQLLTLLKRTVKSYQMIQGVNEDPVQSITGLSSLITLIFKDLPNIMSEYAPIYKE